VAHYAVSVKPPAATPAFAATLVLLRDRPAGGIDVLLVRRHPKSRFAAGDFAFPGGKLTSEDNPDDAAAWCAGLDAETAAAMLALDSPRAALGFWIGAIRETFEEVGVLLATAPGGVAIDVSSARFRDYRRACQDDNRSFWTMVKRERLQLSTDRLLYFAHWITPEDQPYRFDTRFFAAPMPGAQEPVGDDREVTEVRWVTPRQALEALERGELTMRAVTARNLRIFEHASSVASALDALTGRPVPEIHARVVMVDGKRRVLVPGDPGY